MLLSTYYYGSFSVSVSIIWNLWTFFSFRIEQYALKSPSTFNAIVFYLHLQSIIQSMGSIYIIFWAKMITLT